jgi:hypothetical protein
MMLIKNRGRHSLPPERNLVPRFDNKIRTILSNMLGVTRGKIYPVRLLDIEKSDKTKDTWCIHRCLNVVHEGAGDECVHEKLRADRSHLRCRDTSLQCPVKRLEHL